MRIPRLFIGSTLSVGETLSLPQEKAHHISKVLRMRPGDPILLFNDTGYEFDSRIIELTKKNALVEIGESSQVENESPLNITLCLAIARGQHMDFSIQKAVELGVHKIAPVMSEFSNVKLQDDRTQHKLIHWQNIIISATEQCGKAWLTHLLDPVTFSEWLASDLSTTRLILHPGSQEAMSTANVVTSARPKTPIFSRTG